MQKVKDMVNVMELYYRKNQSAVPVDALDFELHDIMDRSILAERTDIFYSCTAKKVVLVRWIIGALNGVFSGLGIDRADMSLIYNVLRRKFKIISFNRRNLYRLLETDDVLRKSDFERLKSKYLLAYKNLFADYQDAHPDDDEPSDDKLNEELKKLLEEVEPKNASGRLSCLVRAFSGERFEALSQLFVRLEISEVKDLPKVLQCRLNAEIVPPLKDFLAWLSTDCRQRVFQIFTEISKRFHSHQILGFMAAGKSVEDTCLALGLTKERFKKIENKILKIFNRYLDEIRPHYVLLAFSSGTFLIDNSVLEKALKRLSGVFQYLLKTVRRKDLRYDEGIGGFIVGNDIWSALISLYAEELPQCLFDTEFEQTAVDFYRSIQLPVSLEFVRRHLSGCFHTEGKIFSKSKLSRKQKYRIVIEKYFPNGIKLFDQQTLSSFRAYYKELFSTTLTLRDDALTLKLSGEMSGGEQEGYVLKGAMAFSTPHKRRSGHEVVGETGGVLKGEELVREYLALKDEITLGQLRDYINEQNIFIVDFPLFVQELGDEFVRVDRDRLLRTPLFDEHFLNAVEEVLLDAMSDSGYLSSAKITDFSDFPQTAIPWNFYLLRSLIVSRGKNIIVLSGSCCENFKHDIFVSKALNIFEYHKLLYYAVKENRENRDFSQPDDVKLFLQSRGLIGDRMPEGFASAQSLQ